MDKRKNPNGPMQAATIAELRLLVAQLEEKGAADAVGISLPTLGRAIAGMKVAPSVRQLVEAKLRERAAGGAA